MHELSVTENVVRIAVENAEEHGAKRIKQINLVVGELSSIVDDSVQFYFDIISKGTIAEGAKLFFRRMPAECICTMCAKTFEPEPGTYRCPFCGGQGKVTNAGMEFYVDSIEVD